MRRTTLFALLLAFALFAGLAQTRASTPSEVARNVVDSRERLWERIDSDPIDGNYTSREIFNYALALCEADAHLDRLTRLFELAERLQQRDPDKPGYGNFYWYSDRPEVKDRNAVEFCMEPGTLLWILHRDKLSEEARSRMRELMEYSIEGCMNHRVGSTYTNISLMNAGNLIRLGEALDRPEVAEEGYRRFKVFGWYTWKCGIHEYVSSTYYWVDLITLQLIARFSERERARDQAEALMKLLWTDVAANWFEPAERLAGPNSRTYDFLYNMGIKRILRAHGWLRGKDEGDSGHLLAAYGRWRPSEELVDVRNTYPRRIRASWGYETRQARTHVAHRDVTLGCSSAHYHAMDVPLTVDLPGGERRVRGYFIPDGRDDPYGLNPYDIGSGHMKARHLRPFWTAAQRGDDAVGVCIYRLRAQKREDLKALKSHFVLPRNVDGVWLGRRRIGSEDGNAISPKRYPVKPGEALVLRQDTAAVGVRVPIARREDGTPAPISLVDHSTVIEAESGDMEQPFEKREDDAASGGSYVAAPRGRGRLRIPVKVSEAGEYSLWGRVIAPDGKSNSFFVRITRGNETVVPRAAWHVGKTDSWRWRRVALEGDDSGGSFRLPQGKLMLELEGRESGTCIDSVMANGPRAMRLTVNHAADSRSEPGAVGMWVRVGSGLQSAEDFENWRREFEQADLRSHVSGERLLLSAPGDEGPVRAAVTDPWAESARVELAPPPCEGVLEIDGRDVGREMLESVPPFGRAQAHVQMPDAFQVGPAEPALIEAEAGAVEPPFRVEEHKEASGGRCVVAADIGAVRIPLEVSREGDYYLWGRVLAPSGTTDSFNVRVKQEEETVVRRHAWHTGRGKEWRWSPVELRGREPSRRLHLPEGRVVLEFLAREGGTRIDRVAVSSDPTYQPE